MIIEHATFVRKEVDVRINKPLETAKFLLRTAFGQIGARPVLRNVENNAVKMVNNDYQFNLLFDAPNTEFVNSLPLEDVTVFNGVDFGHFFYEYGRTLIALTAITASRVNWFVDAEHRLDEIDTYYSNFLHLSDNIEAVVNAFEKEVGAEGDFNFDFDGLSKYLIKKMDESGDFKDSPDIEGKDIILAVYIGTLFVTLGSLLTLPDDEIDTISYLKNPNLNAVKTIFGKILEESDDTVTRINLLKIAFVFTALDRLYANVSGVKKTDPLIEILSKFCGLVFQSISTETQQKALEDEVSVIAVIRKYNVLNEVNAFTGVLPVNESADIWDWGTNFAKFFKFDAFDENPEKILDFYEPQMKSYVKTIVDDVKDEDIEKGFNYIAAILNNLDNNKISVIDTRTILVLTLLGAAFRKIEKKNSISSNKIIDSKVHSAIDIIDVTLVSLYNLWFKSGKMFKQSLRPAYCPEGAMNKLELLKCETNSILATYMEYVRFGLTENINKSDEAIYRDYFKTKMFASPDKYGDAKFITENLFLSLDSEIFVRECATRGCRSIVYAALSESPDLALEKLVEKCSVVEIPKPVIRSLANLKGESYTGLKVIDKVVYAMPLIREYIQESPMVYMLTVYCVLLDTIQHIFQVNNVANYFDFNRAEAAMDTYKLGSITTDKIYQPVEKVENTDLF